MRIRDNGQSADIISRFDYKPFGEKMPVTPPLPGVIEPMPQRLGFISKEQDRESHLADHGVRKYDYDLGRFTSTDVLFEKYPG
jgi:RHS repeat-associated protein